MEKHLQHLLLLLAAADIAFGQNPVHSRIVGGIQGNIAEYPWQVNLKYQGLPACGGSLITDQWVLTACHCFPQEHALGDYDVVAGTTNLDPTDSSVQVKRIADVIRHPYYDPSGYSNDIALVKLLDPFVLNDYVKIIKLPSASVQIPAGMKCTITGWGNIRTSDPLASPKPLQVAEVTVISRNTCNCLYHINPTANSITTIQSDMMCAGSVDGSVDACQGDSGGPLSCKINNNWYQAGVVSWGEACGTQNKPGVYITVMSSVDWIKSVVPQAQVVDVTINTAATPDDENGCRAADGTLYPYPNKGTTLMVTFISLPLYWLTAYLLTNV